MFSPLHTQAYDHLKDMILSGSLEYDAIYSETKLSKELGISRTPMRDALQRLAQERYIDIIPSKGFCLHRMQVQDIIETYQIRSAIEGYCAVQITRSSKTPEALALFARLEELLAKQRAVFEGSQDIDEFIVYDNQFHVEIVAFSRNETFNDLFETYMFQIRSLAASSLRHEGRMAATLEEHADILRTMEAGNTADIYSVTMRHMETPRGINLNDIVETR